MNELTNAINRFDNARIAIIGDIVADQYLHGTISRISREAPVFILEHDETLTVPGAASNAAMNVRSLGAAIELVGAVGDDEAGRQLIARLGESGVDSSGVLLMPERTTTRKVRVLAGQDYARRQQVIRIDHSGTAGNSGPECEQQLLERLEAAISRSDAVIISDYGYGTVSPEIFAAVQRSCRERELPVIVDSRHRLGEFSGALSATPNLEEVEQLLGRKLDDEAGESLRKSLMLKALLVTNGNKGMTLFQEGQSVRHLDVIGSHTPVDVTGAGDTVIAAYTLGLTSGLDHFDAAVIANHAGGLVVMRSGTATVTQDELLASVGNASQETKGQHS